MEFRVGLLLMCLLNLLASNLFEVSEGLFIFNHQLFTASIKETTKSCKDQIELVLYMQSCAH